jgi:hypothetical protein
MGIPLGHAILLAQNSPQFDKALKPQPAFMTRTAGTTALTPEIVLDICCIDSTTIPSLIPGDGVALKSNVYGPKKIVTSYLIIETF